MWQKTKNIYHLQQAILANILYGFPSRGLSVIGVTGTEGKTTTANLIYHILHSAGEKVAVISTTGAIINAKYFDTGLHTTTPGRFALQSYIKTARREKVKYIVLEISSHALDQYRAMGINFSVGVITNVANDHLDYHKTWENYVHAKAKLLRAAKIAIVNKDDRSYHRLKKYELKKDKQVITYGMKKDAEINPHVFPFSTKLLGKFNRYNCLAAIGALQSLGLSDSIIRKGIASYQAPVGRQEIIYNKSFTVIIDFATTEYSFNSILPVMKQLATNRLIHVFGSAGQRDFAKRPMLGRVSSEYSNIIVVTAEDPRDESIETINTAIIAGIDKSKFEFLDGENIKYQVSTIKDNKKYVITIPDRKKAIHFAVSLAQKGDVVITTGKGHEQSMNYGNGEESWDEKEAIVTALRDRKLI